MVEPLPEIEKLFIKKSKLGADLVNRQGRQGGNYMDLGSIVQQGNVWNLGICYKQDDKQEWWKKPLQGRKLLAEVEFYIPFTVLQDFGHSTTELQPELKHLGRMECFMEWWLTYNELYRHNARMEIIAETEFFQKCVEIVNSEKDKIHDLMVGYHQGLEEFSDFSRTQFDYYAKEHSGSASPWKVKEPFERRIGWNEVEKDPILAQELWAEMIPKLHYLNHNYDKIVRKGDYSYMVDPEQEQDDIVWESTKLLLNKENHYS
jgi:hypothetical protein